MILQGILFLLFTMGFTPFLLALFFAFIHSIPRILIQRNPLFSLKYLRPSKNLTPHIQCLVLV
jgi:hypothetical protein